MVKVAMVCAQVIARVRACWWAPCVLAGQMWPTCRATAWGMHGTCVREGAWRRVEEQASRPGALGLCWHGALGLCWPDALASAGLVRWVYAGLVRWLVGAGLGLCWCWPGPVLVLAWAYTDVGLGLCWCWPGPILVLA